MSGIDIEGVLSAHTYVPSLARGVSRCACGEQMHGMPHEHRAHVAAVLREQIEGALAEAWDDALGSCNDYSGAAPNPYRAAHLSDTERAGGAG